MVCKFDVYAFREIMKVCGSIISTLAKNHHKSCEYIALYLNPCNCIAYGSNGFQVSRVQVPCSGVELPYEYRLMVSPVKIAPGTRTVEIYIDNDKKEYEIVFLDEDQDILNAVTCSFFDGEPLDYPAFYRKAQDNFDKLSRNGEGKYFIVVNPRYLINALEGLKSCDSVILNFGDQVDPFTIRPYDDSMDASAMVFPVRPKW